MTLERSSRLPIAFTIIVLVAGCRLWSSDMMRNGEMRDRMRGQMPGPAGGDQAWPTPEVTRAPTSTPGGTAQVSYSQEIQPILDRACVVCHGGQGGLFVDSYDNLMAGGASGKVVVPGEPESSELVRRIRGSSLPLMPPGEPALTLSDIETIELWIAEGSPNN